MKLTIKELAPYLPYELNVIDALGTKQEIVGYDGRSKQYELMRFEEKDFTWRSTKMRNFKPILIPLSDLMLAIKEKKGLEDLFKCSINKKIDFNKVCVSSYNWLLENHFDVFGLIEKGLAIDKNTLEK